MGVRAMVLTAALLLGCGQEQIIGFVCDNPGSCEAKPPVPPPPCGAEYQTLPLASVTDDEEFCWIFDLEELGDEDEELYLTGLSMDSLPEGKPYLATLSRLSHHINIQLVDGELFSSAVFPSGATDCGPFFDSSVPPEPLVATLDQLEGWTFDPAFPISPTQRLLINQHLVNDFAEPVELGLDVRLQCTHERPEKVSRSLSFIANERKELEAATDDVVEASCNVESTLDLFRLYRRTHLIEWFEVGVSNRGSDDYQLLWGPTDDSPCVPSDVSPARCDFGTPFRIEAESVLHWKCGYLNQSDRKVVVGGTTDACALFGNYTLAVENADDRTMESCSR